MTGTEILRRRLTALKERSLGLIVRDLWEDHKVKVPLDTLQAFVNKGSTSVLPVDVLRAITKIVFKGHAEYRFEDDTIVSANREVKSVCGPDYAPARYVPPTKIEYIAGVPPPPLGPQPPRKYIPLCERPAEWPPRWS